MAKIKLKQIDSAAASTGAVVLYDGTAPKYANQSTAALLIPAGTTAQRPGSAIAGMLRFNSESNSIETFANSVWKSVGASGTTLADYGITDAYTKTAADARYLALAGGTMAGAIAMGNNAITGLPSPSNSGDAATKGYVDATAQGLDVKASVRAATTTAGTLATSFVDGSTIDNVPLSAGDRILIKDQSNGAENGIYVVNLSGVPTRATDANTSTKVTFGMFTFVESGTVNANNGFVLATGGNIVVNLGTTALTFVQFSGAGEIIAGAGISKSGNTLSLTNTTVTPNTYNFATVTVDAQGRITSASSGAAVTSIITGTGLSGGTITSTGTIALANTTVTPNTYIHPNITVDAQGRLTSAINNPTFAAGSATSPGWAVSGDTSSGLFQSSSGNLSISGGGSEAVRIIGAGNNGNMWLTLAASQNGIPALGVDSAFADTSITIKSKGAGTINFKTGSTSVNQMAISDTAGATNYVLVSGSNTGAPTVSVAGLSSDISLDLVPKGAGALQFAGTAFLTTMSGASTSTFLRGDGTWAAPPTSTGTVTSVIAGTGLSGGTITTTGTIALANTTVTPNTYSLATLTVDAQGRITSASNGVAVTSIIAGTGLSGGTIISTGTIALANTTVTPNSYTNASITVDAQGRLTAASTGSTFAAGTAATPGWAVIGDTATGLFQPSSGNLSIAAGGSEALRILGAGSGGNMWLTMAASQNGIPVIGVDSTFADTSIILQSKGAGTINFKTGATPVNQMAITDTAGATNYVLVTGSNAGAPKISVDGTSTNVSLNLVPKGTGGLQFAGTSFLTTMSGASNTTFLRGDGTWATPSTSTGTVTNIATGTGLSGGPITTTGTISLTDTAVTPNTYNFATVTVNQQGRITSASSGAAVTSIIAGTGLSGGTITSTGTIALANTTVAPNSYSNASITVDAQGRLTAASTGSTFAAGTAASPGWAVIGDTGTGLFQPSTGNLSISGGGSEAVRIIGAGVNGNMWLTLAASQNGIPAIGVDSAFTDTSIIIKSKGAGTINFKTGATPVDQMAISDTASAVNYLLVTGGAAGNAPQIGVTGSDANIGLNLVPKGTGALQFAGTTFLSSMSGASTSTFLRGDGTWASPTSSTGTVTNIATGTGLSGGPITSTGTISLANTTVTPNTYNFATVTVDAQGRITSASNGAAVTSIIAGTGLSGGTITSTGTIALANTTVAPNSYTNASITVDAQGRLTAASTGSTFAAGSAGTPGWAVSGDTTTGLFQGTAGQLSISGSGGEALRIIGAGTSTNMFFTMAASQNGIPVLSTASGSLSNVNMAIRAKGTGSINLQTGATPATQFVVFDTPSAVNNLAVTGSATTGTPQLAASGTDTNIGLNFVPKGTGTLQFAGTPFLTTMSGASTSTFLRGDGTWTTPVSSTGTVTNVATGTGLTGGPITTTGTIALTDTVVTPGAYTLASITVDQQGRITAASTGTSFPAGSAPTPGWAVTGNLSSGLFQATTNTLSIAAGGGEVVRFLNSASSTAYLALSSPSASNPTIAAIGTGDITLTIASQNGGSINFLTSPIQQFQITYTGLATNFLSVTGNNGNSPTLSAVGTSTNIGINLATKGTGALQLNGTNLVSSMSGASTATFLRGDASWSAIAIVQDTAPTLGGDLSTNGHKINGVLWGTATTAALTDNQTTAATLFTFNSATYKNLRMEFAATKNAITDYGKFMLYTNGTTLDYVQIGGSLGVGTTGIVFSATISTGTVSVQYTTTNTGAAGSITYVPMNF